MLLDLEDADQACPLVEVLQGIGISRFEGVPGYKEKCKQSALYERPTSHNNAVAASARFARCGASPQVPAAPAANPLVRRNKASPIESDVRAHEEIGGW